MPWRFRFMAAGLRSAQPIYKFANIKTVFNHLRGAADAIKAEFGTSNRVHTALCSYRTLSQGCRIEGTVSWMLRA